MAFSLGMRALGQRKPDYAAPERQPLLAPAPPSSSQSPRKGWTQRALDSARKHLTPPIVGAILALVLGLIPFTHDEVRAERWTALISAAASARRGPVQHWAVACWHRATLSDATSVRAAPRYKLIAQLRPRRRFVPRRAQAQQLAAHDLRVDRAVPDHAGDHDTGRVGDRSVVAAHSRRPHPAVHRRARALRPARATRILARHSGRPLRA